LLRDLRGDASVVHRVAGSRGSASESHVICRRPYSREGVSVAPPGARGAAGRQLGLQRVRRGSRRVERERDEVVSAADNPLGVTGRRTRLGRLIFRPLRSGGAEWVNEEEAAEGCEACGGSACECAASAPRGTEGLARATANADEMFSCPNADAGGAAGASASDGWRAGGALAAAGAAFAALRAGAAALVSSGRGKATVGPASQGNADQAEGAEGEDAPVDGATDDPGARRVERAACGARRVGVRLACRLA
jgi:hypothetical protein